MIVAQWVLGLSPGKAGRLSLQNAHLGLFEELELSWGSLCCRRQLYMLYMLYEQYALCKQYKLSRLLP